MSKQRKLRKVRGSARFSTPTRAGATPTKPRNQVAETYWEKSRATTDPKLAQGYRNLAVKAQADATAAEDLALLRKHLDAGTFGPMQVASARKEITRLEGTLR